MWKEYELETIPDGTWTYYFENGSIADERTYKKGELIRSKNYKLFFTADTLICSIADGKPFTGVLNQTGIVGKELFPNRFTTQVINGHCEGSYNEYQDKGDKISLSVTITFKEGKMDGELKQYHENGQLMATGFYVRGQLEGTYTYYYADTTVSQPHGTIEYQCNYSNNELHGTARWYYPDGKIKEEMEYLNGKPNIF